MQAAEYMWQMFRFKKRTIDEVGYYILELFVQKDTYSAWQITKSLKKSPYQIAYENVLKRIHSMAAAGLIKAVDTHFPRNAIHYKLSSEGLYYILRWPYYHFLDTSGNKVFENYGNDDVFEIFLYPYINKKTVTDLNNIAVYSACLEYVSLCCKKIQSLLDEMEAGNIAYDTQVSTDVVSAAWPQGNLSSLYNLLFNINKLKLPLALHPKLEKISDEELRVSYDGYLIILKMYREEGLTKINVREDDGKTWTHQCSIRDLGFDIRNIRSSSKYGHWIEQRLESETNKFREEFVQQLRYGYDFLERHKVPMSILANDNKFALALEESKVLFDKQYNKIMNVRKNP